VCEEDASYKWSTPGTNTDPKYKEHY